MFSALALTGTLLGSTAPGDAPGNVLILIADDLGIDALAAYGATNDPIPTPNLDLLAAEGVLFLNAWVQPTCSPTRATIQTGRYAFRTGIGTVINVDNGGAALSLDEVTLPEMLDLGTGGAYAHAAIGKWHLGTSQVGGDFAPNLAGYSYFAGSLEGQIEDYYHWRRVVNGVGVITSRYATTECVDDALGWIHAQDGPWTCVVSFQAPHKPFQRPPASLHTQTLPSQDPARSCGGTGGDPWPFYKATVEALDTEIGRLLATLPSSDKPYTTVIFLGDNGSENCISRAPFPGRSKGTLYEGGVRVPFVVSGYRVEDSGPCAALVSSSDLFATVAELAGVDLSVTLPGHTLDSYSLVPCLGDRTQRVRTWLYAEVFSPNGPGNPVVQPPCAVECQPSLGFDGPGDATFTVCGPPLYGAYGANNVTWQVSGAPPNANAWLVIGPFEPAYHPWVSATLVSPTPDYIEHFLTAADGTLSRTTWTGNTSNELNYQFVVQDPSQPGGFGVTSAVQVNLLSTDTRAVRRGRYKLIRYDPCREEMFDLKLDPLESTNLLSRPLTILERAAYGRLTYVLDTLR